MTCVAAPITFRSTTARYPIRRIIAASVLTLAITATVLLRQASSAAASEAAWAALRQPGHVALMRHALAPGFGDPAGWRLDECATQRNLNEAGRAQARRVGAEFEKRQLRFDLVLSSAWCRCTETARLVVGRPPEVFSGLNSFFEDRSTEAQQMAKTRAKIASR